MAVIELGEKLLPSMSLLKDALKNKISENKNVIKTVVRNVKEVLKIAAPRGKYVLPPQIPYTPVARQKILMLCLILL